MLHMYILDTIRFLQAEGLLRQGTELLKQVSCLLVAKLAFRHFCDVHDSGLIQWDSLETRDDLLGIMLRDREQKLPRLVSTLYRIFTSERQVRGLDGALQREQRLLGLQLHR